MLHSSFGIHWMPFDRLYLKLFVTVTLSVWILLEIYLDHKFQTLCMQEIFSSNPSVASGICDPNLTFDTITVIASHIPKTVFIRSGSKRYSIITADDSPDNFTVLIILLFFLAFLFVSVLVTCLVVYYFVKANNIFSRFFVYLVIYGLGI